MFSLSNWDSHLRSHYPFHQDTVCLSHLDASITYHSLKSIEGWIISIRFLARTYKFNEKMTGTEICQKHTQHMLTFMPSIFKPPTSYVFSQVRDCILWQYNQRADKWNMYLEIKIFIGHSYRFKSREGRPLSVLCEIIRIWLKYKRMAIKCCIHARINKQTMLLLGHPDCRIEIITKRLY